MVQAETSPETAPDTVRADSGVCRRNPWLALLLSLLATGTGQVYDGRPRRGLAFFAAELALGSALALTMRTFAGLAVNLGLLLLLNLYAMADAVVLARRAGDFRPGPWNRGWIYVLAVVVCLASGSLVQSGEARLYEAYKAPSGSMLPTLEVGDHFMAEVLSPSDPVARGDVVIFWEKESARHFVKRVVGLPGETVRIEDQRVFINGRPVADPHAFHAQAGARLPRRDVMASLPLGPDAYFVMGDNRDYSYDSRFLGPIDRRDMEGRALYVYLPGPAPEGRLARLGASLR